MRLTRSELAPQGSTMSIETTRMNFRRMERREWWLWSAAVTVTLLLTAGLASFLFPALHGDEELFLIDLLPQAVRGLLGLVLLFDIYALYQQLQIHRMRRRLFEREELFRLISENAADLIAVVDMEGRRIYNSLSYQKVLGYSEEELKSSTYVDQVHPEDRERVKEAAEEARRTGIGRPLEYRIRHKDGSWRVLESTASVIRNSEGDAEKLVVVNRDVTDRKLAAEALRRSEASFRSVVEDAPYGIYRAGLSGQLFLVNSTLEQMLGYGSQDELLKANLATDIYCDPGEHQRLIETFPQDQDFKDIEFEWKRKDGTRITVKSSGRPVRGETGEFAYLEVFAEDITQRRVLEKQLRTAQKMETIGRLSGGIAHDFNNLLGVIMGYSQVMKRSLGVADEAAPGLQPPAGFGTCHFEPERAGIRHGEDAAALDRGRHQAESNLGSCARPGKS
jgi:PAS domain S-box-containing protein